MGEVTEEADLEVKKQDCASEPLPEPLLIILSPPPPFLPAAGEPAIFWNKWLKAFEHYLEALGENELVDSSKCALLQNCLGQEGQRVFASLSQREASYASAVSALTVYFGSDASARPHLVRFYQRAQRPGESVEQFASALDALLRPCRLGGSQEKLVLRQLWEKTRCPLLKERLLAEKETLTLDVALAIGREVESAGCDPELFAVHEVSVDIGDDSELPVRRKRGRPRRGEARPKPKPKSPKPNWRSSRYRDEFYYNNDKLYHSDGDECRLGTADDADPTPDKSSRVGHSDDADDDDNGCSSSLVKEEDALDKASEEADEADEDDDEDDEDFVVGRAKGKGPSCPFCPGRRFRDTNKLARHMRTHTKEKPFNCPLCSLTFSQSYHMTRHMRNQHGAGRHICPTCGKSLESAADLRAHRRTHSSQEPSCPEWRDRFPDMAEDACQPARAGEDGGRRRDEAEHREKEKSLLREDDHEVSSSNEDEDDSGSDNGEESCSDVDVKAEDKDSDPGGKRRNGVPKVKAKGHFCPICVNRCFRGANKLARHMRMHTKEKPFSCPVCSLTFSQSYHMTRHLRKQHGMGHYICTKCGASLGSWVELKEHKKTHVAEGLSCSACQKQFKEKAALVNHLKSHKKDKSAPRCLSCSDCGKEFCRMYHLKRHILAHRKATNGECYNCPECQKSYAFPEDLKKHRRIHAKENNGTCPKCNQTFGSLGELETHMAVHKKSFACNTCGKKFKVEYALKKHEQGHQVEQYYCSLCRKRFIKLSHYKRHVLVHGRRESRCPHCDGVFLKLTALKYHLRTHTEERPFQCSCCIESFEEKRDLEQHCLKHRKFKRERPYSCTRCDYAFPSLLELTEHMSLHVGEQPLSCPVCGKTFLNKNKLEKHLSIHTGERPHLCSLCGNGFPSAASLKLHSHIHTGEKPFKCSVCGKSFSSSSGLRLHGRQHMEVRPSYECPECGRTYGRMTELKMHQRYHTGDKPYACTCCSKRFISKDKLNVHMRIHTGERPYSCPHCGQTFTQTGDRNRHINKYHS